MLNFIKQKIENEMKNDRTHLHNTVLYKRRVQRIQVQYLSQSFALSFFFCVFFCSYMISFWCSVYIIEFTLAGERNMHCSYRILFVISFLLYLIICLFSLLLSLLPRSFLRRSSKMLICFATIHIFFSFLLAVFFLFSDGSNE